MTATVTEKRHCLNPGCGKELTLPKGQRNWAKGKGRFCSRKCTSQQRAKDQAEIMRGVMAKRRRVVVEEVDFLVGTDASENLARRLGYRHVDSLVNHCREEGRDDLATKLINHQYQTVKEFDPWQ